MKESVIKTISRQYPQLLLPLDYQTKTSQLYKSAVLRGEPLSIEPQFITSEKDSMELADTPAGQVQVLVLEHRKDFEHALCALAYKCEPRDILPSVGANTIGGLINWEKIRAHKAEYFSAGGSDWQAEFKRFTADRVNYRDTLILLSSGEYSAVSAEQVGMDANIWRQKSIEIRKYHELTHFVCRSLYPERIDVLRDEIYADCIGLIAAFGNYNPAWAKLFLGIETEKYRKGGRLEHYVEESGFEGEVSRANTLIEEAKKRFSNAGSNNIFEILCEIYP